MSISSVSSTGYAPAPDNAAKARLDREDAPVADPATPPPGSPGPAWPAVTADRQAVGSIGSQVDIYL